MTDLQPTQTLTDAFVGYLEACKIEDVRAMSYYWRECQRHHAGWQDEHERRAQEVERAEQMEARMSDELGRSILSLPAR